MDVQDALRTAIKETDRFVDGLSECLGKNLTISAEFDKICICGVGGSAIGGDIVTNIMAHSYDVPVTVVRAMDIPLWVNSKTFVIVCSYSGNTNETLSMYDHAVERGCHIAAITSGGELLKKAESRGDHVAKLKGGMQPRNALGLIMGHMISIIEALGGPECRKDLKKIIPMLYEMKKDLSFENPGSYAKEIADKINGTVPVIYATSGISASAMRWKTQINENSKMLAFCGELPEFNHNEVVGWSESNSKYGCAPVFLYENDSTDSARGVSDASLETLRSYGIEPVVVSIKGKTIMERSLRAIMLGDYVSIYLAAMNGMDPVSVGSVVRFKEIAAKHIRGS